MPGRWGALAFVCLIAVHGAGAPGVFAGGACPTGDDLDYGLVVTDRGWNQGNTFHYRRLEGDYFGYARVDAVLAGRKHIWLASLMERAQINAAGTILLETTDVEGAAGFLEMEPGGVYQVTFTLALGLGSDALKTEVEWDFAVADAGTVTLGACPYRDVQVTGTQTLHRWNGTRSTYDLAYTYLPELRLKLRGDRMHTGEIVRVRKRLASDGSAWPFSDDAAAALPR
ncbi:MAG: hypothetical protein AAGF60_16055 [Pseudomonadota bacterium]